MRWDKVDHHIERWKREGLVDKIAVVSLGDEIGLAEPSADCHAEFRKWLENQRVSPADVDPRAGGDWQKIRFDVSHDSVSRSPSLYYYSRRYVNHFGIMAQKKLTDDLRGSFPTAGIGANYSPYRGHYFLGDTNMFVTMFRREGMTMPWSEDYIWHVPVGSADEFFES